MSDELNVEFQVPFVHRLRFTKDLFGEDQDVLAGLLTSSDENPARVQFWIDQNVAAGAPQLVERLKRFADSRPQEIQRHPELHRHRLLPHSCADQDWTH